MIGNEFYFSNRRLLSRSFQLAFITKKSNNGDSRDKMALRLSENALKLVSIQRMFHSLSRRHRALLNRLKANNLSARLLMIVKSKTKSSAWFTIVFAHGIIFQQTIINRKSTRRRNETSCDCCLPFVFIVSLERAWVLMLPVKLIKREVGDFQGRRMLLNVMWQ